MKKHLFFWASLLVAGLALTACGGDDADDFSDKTTPVAPTGKQKWTVTVGAGVMTRGLNDDLTPNWSTDDEVYVYYGSTLVGTLKPTAASNSGSVTLTGELDEANYSTSSGSNKLNLRYKYGASGDFSVAPNYSGQNGTIADIAANYDFMNATVTITAVDNTAKTLTTSTANFQNLQSIFELKFTEPLIEGDEVMISCPSTDVYVTPGVKAANESFYVAIPMHAIENVKPFLDFSVTSSNRNNPYILPGIENDKMQNGKKYTATIKVEAVQLWDGGPWWAVKNIGASDKYDAGSLFAWGETTTKADYGADNYSFFNNGDIEDVNKYYVGDGKTQLDDEDDAAYVLWGSEWSIPTKNNMEELLSKTTITWDASNHGYWFTGNTTGYDGRSIFIKVGDTGDMWTSTLSSKADDEAVAIYLPSEGSVSGVKMQTCGRAGGSYIRPVW